jgi:HEPN domain-containing protein
MTGIASDWLTKAHDDLRTVELLEKFPEYPCVVAALHCQQAVEKSLKVFLTADLPLPPTREDDADGLGPLTLPPEGQNPEAQ